MEAVTFTTDDGVRLEGELRLPDGEPRGAAVLCHAHPRHGGSKDHPVLWAIRNDLAATRGLAVLGFNFRGTMGSAGTYGGGRDEVRDARAAVSFVLERIPPADPAPPVLTVGWSFGASVALRAALDDRRVAAIALIGAPLQPHDLALPPLPEPADLRLFARPALLVAGEHDEYCPADELLAFAAGFRDARVEVLAGTDHYFWRREREAAAVVGTFADEVLAP
jgi:alpha/beta superfamily hydrolase